MIEHQSGAEAEIFGFLFLVKSTCSVTLILPFMKNFIHFLLLKAWNKGNLRETGILNKVGVVTNRKTLGLLGETHHSSLRVNPGKISSPENSRH